MTPLSNYQEIFPYRLMNWLYLLLGEVISSATGLMNLTGILSKPLEQSFLSSDINLFTSVNVVCFMTNAPSDSCSGIMVVSFVWTNATFFFLFINLDANSVKYWLRFSGFWLIHFFGGSSKRWTVFHTSFGFRELNAFLRKEAFFDLFFYNGFLPFDHSGGQLGQNGSNHVIWFVDYQEHF